MVTETLAFAFALMTQTYNLPVGLQSSLCWVESGHNVTAMHKDDGSGNSVGICQIKLNTARMLGFKGTERELQTPQTNILYSAKFLRWQLNRYHGDIVKSVAAYNAGSWRINAKGEVKNRYYVKKVFLAWSESK